MKAFLLASGMGTRLRPLTDHTPKCLVDIAGKPLLAYWLEQLVNCGFHDILINTHYLHEQVQAFIAQSPYRQSVQLVYEPELLGTLGSIRANRDFFAPDPEHNPHDVNLIIHADNFCLTDWPRFLQAYRQRPAACDITMMLFNTPTPWSCGLVKTDAQGVLTDYLEKPQAAKTHPERYGSLANAAVFIANQAALARMYALPQAQNDVCRDFLPLQIGTANTFVNEHVHIDIGTPETYAQANKLTLTTDTLKQWAN